VQSARDVNRAAVLQPAKSESVLYGKASAIVARVTYSLSAEILRTWKNPILKLKRI
jgi:hypothetical protein